MTRTDLPEPRVKRTESVPSTVVLAGTAAAVQVLLGPADGAPNFALRKFSMGAGGGMPLHTNCLLYTSPSPRD